MDIIDKFSTNLKNALTRALCLAAETKDHTIQPEHLLWALGTQKGSIATELLKKVGIKQTALEKIAGGVTPAVTHENIALQLSEDARRAVEKAVLTANTYGHKYIGTEHLLSGLLQIDTPHVTEFFSTQKTNVHELRHQMNLVLKNTSKFPEMTEMIQPQKDWLFDEQEETEEEKQPEKLQALSYFARELTAPEHQERLDPVIGRDTEIERVMEILCRRTKNNPLLIGEPGVGKTAIVEGLAKLIAEGTAPAPLQHKRIFALDLTLMIAGTMYRGEFEARVRQVIEEVSKAKDIILFIDELHTIVGAGSASGSMDAANMLKPALARGEIKCIGATTLQEFKKHIESDSALERRFQTVTVEEPDQAAAVIILQGIASQYESFHGVRITADAIESAVRLSTRYLTDRHLPDKAIDILDEASAHTRMHAKTLRPQEQERALERKIQDLKKEKREAIIQERFLDAVHLKATEDMLKAELVEAKYAIEQEETQLTVTEEDVAGVIARMMRIPVTDLLAREQHAFATIEDRLKARVMGQDLVITRVAGALKRAKLGIAHPARPLASFLFLGPSGVGKTELARTIAEHYFHHPKNLIRLDMSEYAEGFTTSKLIGAPAGYVGYKDQANLTDRVRQKPYSVVLFDEIEKAHRDVQNLLLQILEEGELADATGKMVNFRNTIVILTSNVGLERFETDGLGFTSGATEIQTSRHADILKEVQERFRPELVNRLDHTCIFEPLTKDVLSAICKHQLADLELRMHTKGIALVIEPEVVTHLTETADTKTGARAIRQAIQTHVEHAIAERLLKKDKPKTLAITLEKKRIAIRKR